MNTNVFDRKGLLKAVLKQFKVDRHGVHGPSHWARVRYHALMIGRATGADLLVVELFAFLHDSRRLNEYVDPEHGSRAASYAKELNGIYFHLTVLRVPHVVQQVERVFAASKDAPNFLV